MSFWKTVTLTLASTAFVAGAHAITISDVDIDGLDGDPDWVYLKSNSHHSPSSWSGTFDLLDGGFDPLTMQIISATISFAFADDYDYGWEFAKVVVGPEANWDWLEVNGDHHNSPTSYDWYSTSLSAKQLMELQDGVIDYSVDARYGDFYLKEASLQAEVEIRVPDSGMTIAMLGLGMATLAILRKQMKSGANA